MGFLGVRADRQHSAVSADFEHTLTREILLTERMDGGDAVPLGEVALRGYDRPMPIWQLG
jgi:hypothetical protein